MNATAIYIYNKVEKLLQCLLLPALLALPAAVSAQLQEKYTKQRPIVIICDWEFPPYEFSNDDGQADGFNIDLLKTILDKAKLPYKFVMKECYQACEAFERHEADLTVDPAWHYRAAPYYSTRNILYYYKMKVAGQTTKPATNSIELSGEEKVFLFKSYDDAALNTLKQLVPNARSEFHSANECMVNVSSIPNHYFIWGEEPLKWYVKEMNLSNITIYDADMPATESHIVGYDKRLIDEIDDQYARLEQSGELQRLHDKWFNPERVHNDASPVAIYISLAILLLAVVLILLNRLAKQRARMAARRTKELESMMLQALSMTHYSIIDYNTSTQRFTNRHGTFIPKEGATLQDISNHMHPDEKNVVRRYFLQLMNGQLNNADLKLRWKPFNLEGQPLTSEETPWQIIQGHAIVEYDDKHHTRHIMCTTKYVTEEEEQQKADSDLGSRYNKIFETSLVAMSFYDKDGWLIDLNQKMRELCGFTKENEKYIRGSNLFDNPFLRDDYDPEKQDNFHVCQHLHFSELGIDKYVEMRIRTVKDDNGQLMYYTITARDMTDERTIIMEQRRHDEQLQEVNNKISAYESQLRYLLEHSEMFVWEIDLATRHISFSRSLSKVDFSETYESYLGWLVESEREEADHNLLEKMMKGMNFNAVHHFTHTSVNPSHCWYALSGLPTFNKDKRLTGYFGIVRDITKLMEAQEQLKQETRRADESGKLKSVFLANMTHEIRTPLNAIVGFSDLLQVIDDPNDRREFIRIIRNNCDMLLRLIDDIIEASNMNQGPIAIDAQDVDFAVAFNDICQTLAQRVQEPGVQFIVDNPYQYFVTCIDKGRMQQVITNFTTNAVKYTRQGHIKVGYRYCELPDQPSTGQKGLYMYCEDTGAGIPKDKQKAVFDRFVKLNDYVQGTGLGLSICKSIADRCGGSIGVNSEGEGHGSTFWIWIPCDEKGHRDNP